jgi:hypothetical protein
MQKFLTAFKDNRQLLSRDGRFWAGRARTGDLREDDGPGLTNRMQHALTFPQW